MRATSVDRGLTAMLVPALALLAACAPTPLPSTSPDVIATIVAATQRAAPTFTPLTPSTRTPSPTPTPLPTPIRGTPENPARLSLTGGATSAVIDGQINPGETKSFSIRGAQGQPMLLQLDSPTGDAGLSMMSQGGTFFIRPGVTNSWRGVLPQAGVYYFGVYGGADPTTFRLNVTLITRVVFKEGEDSTTVVGRTPDGTTSALSIFGLKGARMIITLSGTGTEAALSVEGFADHKLYLDASEDKRSFTMVTPATQDYIIRIIPDAGATTNYVFDVNIQ